MTNGLPFNHSNMDFVPKSFAEVAAVCTDGWGAESVSSGSQPTCEQKQQPWIIGIYRRTRVMTLWDWAKGFHGEWEGLPTFQDSHQGKWLQQPELFLKQEVIRRAILMAGWFLGPLQGGLLRAGILFFPLRMEFQACGPVAQLAEGGRAARAVTVKCEFLLRQCKHKAQLTQHQQWAWAAWFMLWLVPGLGGLMTFLWCHLSVCLTAVIWQHGPDSASLSLSLKQTLLCCLRLLPIPPHTTSFSSLAALLKLRTEREQKPIQQRQINEQSTRKQLALKLKLFANFLLVLAGKQIISSAPALGAWLLFSIWLGLRGWEFNCLQHLQRQSQ